MQNELKLTAFITSLGTIVCRVDMNTMSDTAEITVYDACIVTKAPKKIPYNKLTNQVMTDEEFDELLNNGDTEAIANVVHVDSQHLYEDVYSPIICDEDFRKTMAIFNLNQSIMRFLPANELEISTKINGIMGRSKIISDRNPVRVTVPI